MSDLPRAVLLHPNDGCAPLARELLRRGVEVHLLSPPGTEWLTVRGTRAHQLPVLPTGAETGSPPWTPSPIDRAC